MDIHVAAMAEPLWDNQVFDLVNSENSLDVDDLNPSSASASGQTTPCETDQFSLHLDSAQPSQVLVPDFSSAAPATKKGGRLDKPAVAVLKRWLEVNENHPYPSSEDVSVMQYQTGLSTTQIAHWFSNARRRRKIQRARSSFQFVEDVAATTLPIPHRPGTPAPRRSDRTMTPIERWYDSPPESEPAAAIAIARAMSGDVALTPKSLVDWSQDDQSYGLSPASSFGTSDSSDFSAASGNSNPSSSTQGALRPRSVRKKRNHKRRNISRTPLANSLLPYQCTFCTETFRTKHDWQRHEKSLHLALEQWICSPNGPCAIQDDIVSCAFCAQVDPDEAHLETHNFRTCQERGLEDRTFLRKDHLNQHLRLVHGVQYLPSSMDSWKARIPDIESRCGFCGQTMSTWPERADHLAGHYKRGKTMRDWHGDWGFARDILKMVENAIPPYYIEWERYTPTPYKAGVAPVNSPTNAYDLVRVEIEDWIQNRFDISGKMPSNQEMQLEACRIIFASEAASATDSRQSGSWLRDLLMSSDELATRAKFGPLRMRNEGILSRLQINGKDNLFELCPLEAELRAFVEFESMMGNSIRDNIIQDRACQTIPSVSSAVTTFSDTFKNFITTLIYANPSWLSTFKQRAGISCTKNTEMISLGIGEMPYPMALGVEPQGVGDPTTFTLSQQYSCIPTDSVNLQKYEPCINAVMEHSHYNSHVNNVNFHDWLLRDLTRWVKATMSPNNPNRHIPSDEEIQHQARWMMYNDDDPWNQTAADTAEWLSQFKSDMGIVSVEN